MSNRAVDELQFGLHNFVNGKKIIGLQNRVCAKNISSRSLMQDNVSGSRLWVNKSPERVVLITSALRSITL